MLPYSCQWLDEEDIREVIDVLRSDWLTQGARIDAFEKALCEYTGAKYAVVVSSGTAALHCACMAAGIIDDSEVITSPITFLASSNSVIYCNGKPIFADINRDTINIDPEEIKKKITDRTKALMPVHFAGLPCDMEKISSIAKDFGLIVIEDASHAIGSVYMSSKIGSCSFSDFTVFSFHPVKTITTGEGGAILTNNPDFYQDLLLFRNHGITRNKNKFYNPDEEAPWYYEMQKIGYNYRLSDIHAALGISQLKKIDSFIKRRREIVYKYKEAFKNNNIISFPSEPEGIVSAYHLFVIHIDFIKLGKTRNSIVKELLEKDIKTQVHYIPVHLQPFYRVNYGYKDGDFPVAENYYRNALSIPLYPKMTDKESDYVIECLLKVIEE